MAINDRVDWNNGIIISWISTVPEILHLLNATKFVQLTGGITPIIRHQIRHAAALFVRHLTATLCHAIDKGVFLEHGELKVIGTVTIAGFNW